MYSTTTSLYDTTGATALLGMSLAMTAIMVIIVLIIAIIQIIAMWKMFTKAGKPGWAAIIPIYNLIVLYQIVGINPLFILILVGCIIPFVQYIAAIAYFILSIFVYIRLAKAFGKSGGFAVGLIFLPFIFECILGFGSAEYQGIPE